MCCLYKGGGGGFPLDTGLMMVGRGTSCIFIQGLGRLV